MEKIREIVNGILESKWKIAISAGVIAFILANALLGGVRSNLATEKAKNEELTTKLEKTNLLVQETEEKLKDAESKLTEAAPWFEMKEEERLQKEAQVKKEKEEREAKEKAEEEAKKKAELEARTITFGNGNYVAGTDFEGGTYDIIAISGTGNVSSDNMFSGGINAMMGVVSGDRSDFYEKEYKNIKLPNGTTLKIDGVKIKLVPKE